MMQTARGWVLVNGQLPSWHKSVDGLNDVLRQAGAADSLDALDEATDAFQAACESGRLSGVEADLGLRALGRALRRLEGPAAGGAGAAPAAEGKTDGYGRLEYGAAVPGVRLVK